MCMLRGMPADTQPAASDPSLARRADRGVGAITSRILLGLAGLGLLVGFFLPWIRLGNTLVLSGFSLSVSSGDAVDVVSGPSSALLFVVPVSAVALMVCAYLGHRISVWVALLSSVILLGYGAFTVVRLFLQSTGAGMWLVVGCAMLSFAVGLIGYGRRTNQ